MEGEGYTKEFTFEVKVGEAEVSLALDRDPDLLTTKYQTPFDVFRRQCWLQIEDAMRNQLRPQFVEWYERIWKDVMEKRGVE